MRVLLPASREAPAADPLAREHGPPAGRGRVLFVDDEELILRVAADALAPHEVITASSGREAIRLLERDRFDAVVCDLQMPDLGGVDVWDWVVANRPELATRVVFISGGVFTERSQRLLETVDRPHVTKPFDLDEIAAIVNDVVRGTP
jgi:CheY-like chemotaxis protein